MYKVITITLESGNLESMIENNINNNVKAPDKLISSQIIEMRNMIPVHIITIEKNINKNNNN